MKKATITPAAMDRIINIQMMNEVICKAEGIEPMDKQKHFNILSKKSAEHLFTLQCDMIPAYNEAIKSINKG